MSGQRAPRTPDVPGPEQPQPPDISVADDARRRSGFEIVVENPHRPGYAIVALPHPDNAHGSVAAIGSSPSPSGSDLDAASQPIRPDIVTRAHTAAATTIEEHRQRVLSDPSMRSLAQWMDHPDFAEQRQQLDGTWVNRESADADIVAYFSAETLVGGFVNAFNEVRQTGIVARLVPGMVSLEDVNPPVDLHAQQRDRLTKQLDGARRRVRNFTTAIGTADNEATAKAITASLNDAHGDVERFARELDQLAEPTATVRLPAHTTYTDVIAKAMRRLAECENRVSQEEKIALHTVIPVLRADYIDGSWWGTAFVRVNEREVNGTSGGVIEFGPITWRLETARAQLGTHVLNRLDTTRRNMKVQSRPAICSALEEAGLVRDAALAVVNGPRELAFVLLHQLTGDPLPDDTDDEWRDPVLGEHLARTWSAPVYGGFSLGRYTTFPPLAQAVTDYAATHETFTIEEVMAATWLVDSGSVTDLLKTRSRRSRPINPLIERVIPGGARVNDNTVLRGIRCVCGQVASIVCRRYEVPRDLLCLCRRMPDAEKYGLPADFRFPSNYLLRPTTEEVLVQTRAMFEERMANPSEDLVALLAALAARGGSATLWELHGDVRAAAPTTASAGRLRAQLTIARRLGLTDMSLGGLRGRGNGRGSVPATWTLTDPGAAWVHKHYVPAT